MVRTVPCVFLFREIDELETHLPVLATIDSISPYIGLFRYRMGIMHAFIALSAVKCFVSDGCASNCRSLDRNRNGSVCCDSCHCGFWQPFATKLGTSDSAYFNFMDEFSTILNRQLGSKGE